MIGWRRVLGRELGGERLDRALRIEHLAGADAGELQLDGQRLGEQPRIALGDAGAAAAPHPDLGDAERLQGAQRVARDDAADAEAGGDLLLGAQEVAGLQALGEQRLAHVGDDLRGEGRRVYGEQGRARGRPPACGLRVELRGPWPFGGCPARRSLT